MQRALLGVRQAQRHISTVTSGTWTKRTYENLTPWRFLSFKRNISFPNFIPHAPPTPEEELVARTRGRGAQDDGNLSFAEALRRGIDQALTGQPKVANAAKSTPVQGPSLYGKWQELSLDHDKMLHEFDVKVSDSTMVRLIDQPGNEHDVQLWTCLIEFADRRLGRDGIVMIWQSVSKRRNLFQVDGPLAPRFWKLVLGAALSDEKLLGDVVNYAEWLHQAHGARWPDLYSTVIAHFLLPLSCGSSDDQAALSRHSALRWHSALFPSFGPSEDEFAALLKAYVTNRKGTMFKALTSLYIQTPYRKMYDILIPHLYSEGNVEWAKDWRVFLLKHNDGPISMTARPFLRYLGGYNSPGSRLTEDELKVAGLVSNSSKPDLPQSQPAETTSQNLNLNFLFNRAHGEAVGIKEKPYNDNLGAKWFASSWVTLDFAINVIYTMGVQAIGQLSLQSIALREKDAVGVLRRLDQLRQLEIGLPETRYVEAIRYYASVGDDESLQELLHCDIHPDIFDNKESREQLLSDCIRVGNWDTYRLVLKTYVAAVDRNPGEITNRLLESCIHLGNGHMSLKIMQEMAAQRHELEPSVSHYISSFIVQNISPHAETNQRNPAAGRSHLNLHIRLACQLAATRFPPAVEVWRVLLFRLGREKRLGDLERLCFYILRMYKAHVELEAPPMWFAHTADVPEILRFETPVPNFQKLPRSLPLRHEKHPLRQIFDTHMQNSIVRWGFFYSPYNRRAEGAAADILKNVANDDSETAEGAAGAPSDAGAFKVPSNFHMARGIRLLALMRDESLFLSPPAVRKQAELRLVDLFRGEGRAGYQWVGGNSRLTALRRASRCSLAEAKRLCDLAWGGKGDLVSSLLELERIIEQAERRDELKGLQRRAGLMKNPELLKKRGGRP